MTTSDLKMYGTLMKGNLFTHRWYLDIDKCKYIEIYLTACHAKSRCKLDFYGTNIYIYIYENRQLN